MIYLVISVSIVALYIEISHFFVKCGGFRSEAFRFEIPFLVFVLTLLYFPAIKSKFIRFICPTIPILLGYLLFDFFYSYFKRGPRVSDLGNFHTLLDTYTFMGIGVLFVFFLIMLSCVFLVWKHYLSAPRGHFYHLSWKVLLLLTVSLFLSSDSFVKYQEYTFSYLEVSIGGSITENGRFSSLFFYQAKENKNRQMLGQYNSREIDISQMLYPGKVENKQNIHIVVLESFTDPERAKNILFNRPPLASELKPFLKNGKYFSHVMSPVYGGLSAQAEFELLSGIKAFASIGSIDFNVMKGMRTNSFVNRLRSNNYEAIATIATSSYYFNSKDAYKSLGLDEIVFLDDKGSTFKKQTGDKFIFDGDLFSYHLTRIKKFIEKNQQKYIQLHFRFIWPCAISEKP